MPQTVTITTRPIKHTESEQIGYRRESKRESCRSRSKSKVRESPEGKRKKVQ